MQVEFAEGLPSACCQTLLGTEKKVATSSFAKIFQACSPTKGRFSLSFVGVGRPIFEEKPFSPS